jgi:hypothetical protein
MRLKQTIYQEEKLTHSEEDHSESYMIIMIIIVLYYLVEDKVYLLVIFINKGWSIEELFGVKRWRNDSAFITEYMKVDNQIFLIIVLGVILIWPSYVNFLREVQESMDGVLTANLGNYTADDLK